MQKKKKNTGGTHTETRAFGLVILSELKIPQLNLDCILFLCVCVVWCKIETEVR